MKTFRLKINTVEYDFKLNSIFRSSPISEGPTHLNKPLSLQASTRLPTMYAGAKVFDGSVQLHGGGGGYSPESSLPARAVWGKRVLLGLLGIAVLVGVTLGIMAAAGGCCGGGAGADGGDASISRVGGGGGGLRSPYITIPKWGRGAVFDYSVYTWEGAGREKSSQLVKAINVGEDTAKHQYTLGSDTLEDAVEHAVRNGFPFFGRVTTEDLRVYVRRRKDRVHLPLPRPFRPPNSHAQLPFFLLFFLVLRIHPLYMY